MTTVAIIPAAGSSSRFRELGKHYAKTVLPFRGRPIISHIIDRIVEASPEIKEIVIVVNNPLHREQISSAIKTTKNSHLCTIHEFDETLVQMKRGPAKTIMVGLEYVYRVHKNANILIHLSDSLFDVVDIKSVLSLSPSIGVQNVEDQSRWCVVDRDGSYYDKPPITIDGATALTGLYYFNNGILDLLSTKFDGDESQISDILRTLRFSAYQVIAPIEFDFGTIEEYVHARGINHTRSFNSIVETDYGVEKTCLIPGSTHEEKLRREINWYVKCPSHLKKNLPSVYEYSDLLDDRVASRIVMEKIKGINLRDMALYIDRSYSTWREIFDCVERMMLSVKPYRARELSYVPQFWRKIYDKTEHRIIENSWVELTDQVREFLHDFKLVCEHLDATSEVEWFHGDLHFANMFYDLHYRELKVIDPRGDLVGSHIYDLAKLNHSVNGNYDCIDSELYYMSGADVSFFMTERSGIQKAFDEMIERIFPGIEQRRILDMITASLYISMIPLHEHNHTNQKLFLREFQRFYSSSKL